MNAPESEDSSGHVGPSEKVVKPLTPEALAVFRAAEERTGIIYISRIPPGMQPPKVRHLMSAYGEVGRVYLRKEGVKQNYFPLFTFIQWTARPQACLS